MKSATLDSNSNSQGYFPPFLLIEYSKETGKAKSGTSFKPLLEEGLNEYQYIAYIDPVNGYPFALLRNLIAAISFAMKPEKKVLKFISIRDKLAKEPSKLELKESLYFETAISKLNAIEFTSWLTNTDGKGEVEEWRIDLKQTMDRAL